MQLIYRGHVYYRFAVEPVSNSKPRAVNWRYQVEGKTGEEDVVTPSCTRSHVANWRYQHNG